MCCMQSSGNSLVFCFCFQLTQLAVKDYNRSRSYLADTAEREGVPVFEDLSEALECVAQKCKST